MADRQRTSIELSEHGITAQILCLDSHTMMVVFIIKETKERYQRSISVQEIPTLFKQSKGFASPPRRLTSSMTHFFSFLEQAISATNRISLNNFNDDDETHSLTTRIDMINKVRIVLVSEGYYGEHKLSMNINFPFRDELKQSKWASPSRSGVENKMNSASTKLSQLMDNLELSSPMTSPSKKTTVRRNTILSTTTTPTTTDEPISRKRHSMSDKNVNNYENYYQENTMPKLNQQNDLMTPTTIRNRTLSAQTISRHASSFSPENEIARETDIDKNDNNNFTALTMRKEEREDRGAFERDREEESKVIINPVLKQFLSNNPVEQLFSVGTPIYSLALYDISNDTFSSHGIIIDVIANSLLPYYIVLRPIKNNNNNYSHHTTPSLISKIRTETVPILHRDLVDQEQYLTCENIPSNHSSKAPFCEICTGRELHPIIQSDMNLTCYERNLLLELPPMSCSCGKMILRNDMPPPSSSSSSSPVTSSSLSNNNNNNNKTTPFQKVRMTTPLLCGGHVGRIPCCSLECAIRFSNNV